MTHLSHDETRLPDGTPGRLGRYRLVRPISTGGMARVFEGRRESLAGVSPRVAIKVILPDFATDEGFQRLFVNEARIGSQLQHQNLVQIQDFDRQGEHFYLVMEFVDGITVRRAISLCRRHGLLIPVPVIAEIGRQVCDGLHYAHTAAGEDGQPLHLIHRDIKPSNLMINSQGLVKVLDFGISRALFSRERAGTVKGTWGYMAPEQAAGREVGPPADVFGLAAVLYEMATLSALLPETEPEQIKELLAADQAAKRAAALAGPAGALAPLLVRALQRDPAARFPSALALQRALGGLMGNPVIAREQLVHFWSALAELQGDNPASGAFRSQASLLDPASRGSGQVSSLGHEQGSAPPSGAAVSHVSQVSQASQGAPMSFPAEAGGLPVAIGYGPADLDLGEPIEEEEPTPSRRGWPLIGLLATLLALAVLLFAASRVLTSHRGAIPPSPTNAPPDLSLGSVLEAASQVPSESPVPRAGEPQPSRPGPAPQGSATGTRVSGGAGLPSASPRDPVTAPAPTPAPAEVTPAVPDEQPSAAPPAEQASRREGPDGAATGMITLSSRPRAQVILDGEFVGWSPVLQHAATAGSHTVTLVAEDGQRTTFRVNVVAGEEVRKVWLFDSKTWAD